MYYYRFRSKGPLCNEFFHFVLITHYFYIKISQWKPNNLRTKDLEMILFIDDERHYISSYIEELELSGYKVEFRKDPGVGLELMKEHLLEIDLLIMDVMMPPGTLWHNVDTNGGFRTGIIYYEIIRQIAPKLPILIFSNVSDLLVQRNLEDPYCWFIRKEDCDPFELVEEVKHIFLQSRINSIDP